MKEEYGLKDNNHALSVILKWYEEHELEPQLCPKFVAEIEESRRNGKFVKVRDFRQELSNEQFL